MLKQKPAANKSGKPVKTTVKVNNKTGKTTTVVNPLQTQTNAIKAAVNGVNNNAVIPTVVNAVNTQQPAAAANTTNGLIQTTLSGFLNLYSSLFTYRIALRGKTGIGLQITSGCKVVIPTLVNNANGKQGYKKTVIGVISNVTPNVNTGITNLSFNVNTLGLNYLNSLKLLTPVKGSKNTYTM